MKKLRFEEDEGRKFQWIDQGVYNLLDSKNGCPALPDIVSIHDVSSSNAARPLYVIT